MNGQCKDTRAYNASCSKIKEDPNLKIVKGLSGVMESPLTYIIIIILISLFYYK